MPLFLSLTYLLLTATLVDAPFVQHHPTVKLKRIVVQSAGGGIKVRGVQTSQVTLSGQRTLGSTSCTLQAHAQTGVLTITVADAQQAPCQMDLAIALPRRLQVEIHSEAGNVFVSGTQSTLAIHLGQGNAVLGGIIRGLVAQITAGSLSAQGLTGNTDVTLTAGNAQLWFADTKPATVSLQIERGNVTIGTDATNIDSQLTFETGALQCALPQDAQSCLHVRGHVAHGRVIVQQARHP